MMDLDRHVFAARLRGTDFDLPAIGAAWSALSDDDLADYEACLPGQWEEAAESVGAAVAHIRAVRDRMDECLVEIGRVLA